MATHDELLDVPFDREGPATLVVTAATAGLCDDLARESKGLGCSRSNYLLTILHGLGEQGRLDTYIAAKKTAAQRVVLEGRGLDV